MLYSRIKFSKILLKWSMLKTYPIIGEILGWLSNMGRQKWENEDILKWKKKTEKVGTALSKTCTQTHISSHILTTISLNCLAEAMVDFHRYMKQHGWI